MQDNRYWQTIVNVYYLDHKNLYNYMLLFFFQSQNFAIALVICVTAVFVMLAVVRGMVYLAYPPPRMWCYESEVLKKRRRIPTDNDKFYELMLDMKKNERFEIFIRRDDIPHWENLLIRMLTSELSGEFIKKYSLDILTLQRSLYRITDEGTGRRWVVKCDDSDMFKVRYILEWSY